MKSGINRIQISYKYDRSEERVHNHTSTFAYNLGKIRDYSPVRGHFKR